MAQSQDISAASEPQVDAVETRIEEEFGGRPSPWAMRLLYGSLAVLGVIAVLLLLSFIF